LKIKLSPIVFGAAGKAFWGPNPTFTMADCKTSEKLFSEQIFPVAFQRFLDSQHRREQNIYFASFDLLNRSRVKLNQFGEPLLRQTFRVAKPTDCGSETFQLRDLLLRQ